MASTMTYDLNAIRRNLPALADVVYLNIATEGIMAEPVLEAYLESLTRFERYGYWLRRQFEESVQVARERFAALLDAEADEVCITRSGTEGCSFVLGSFG
ncbi:MAG TPA: hypothetical protein VKT80_11330, partial [Chloroflexota bacterium]|nr:hypothetical protein [Chloroflexota bacterium]